jgi:hypothetical protein
MPPDRGDLRVDVQAGPAGVDPFDLLPEVVGDLQDRQADEPVGVLLFAALAPATVERLSVVIDISL